MAKNTKISKENLIDLYIEHVLNYDQKPKNVYLFAKKNNFQESQFYNFYGSFRTLEASIYEMFFDKTLETLHNSKDYTKYDAKNKLLSFYYTFFGNLTSNRSYVLRSLQVDEAGLSQLKILQPLRRKFLDFVDELDLGFINVKNKRLDDFKDQFINESYWIQMLVTIKFWLDDDSADFEKTDLFIEKSIVASFELASIKPLKSVVDFGKFLLKEKIRMC